MQEILFSVIRSFKVIILICHGKNIAKVFWETSLGINLKRIDNRKIIPNLT